MLSKTVNLLVESIQSGGKVLTFGVGGNAANSIHFSAELSGKFEQYEDPLPCVCLSENPSVLTAITNDFGWEYVFSRQIKALAKPGDVVVAFSISTGGLYLLNAIAEVLCSDSTMILICGKATGSLAPWVRDTNGIQENGILWELGSLDTPWVQEEQLRIIHQICRKVKSELSTT